MAREVALQRKGTGFNPRVVHGTLMCGICVLSPCTHIVGFLWVLWFPRTVQKHFRLIDV